MPEQLLNYLNGSWQKSAASEALKIINPASTAVLAEVPLSPAAEVDQAVSAASQAFVGWRRTPVGERIQPLFKLKALLETNLDRLAPTITDECGQTLSEATAELRRAIRNV